MIVLNQLNLNLVMWNDYSTMDRTGIHHLWSNLCNSICMYNDGHWIRYTEKGLEKVMNEIVDENGQLKSNCRNYEWYKAYKRLLNENEQLKQQLKGYIMAFDCGTCRYHNYDWFDDGDEFEVCDKGNNEAQMENHSCIDWEEL